MLDRDADDIELEPIRSEEEDEESAPPDYRITTYPADYTLEVLYRKWRSGEILIPDFQRRFVWKQTQASRLIESFLVGLPVPAVFFYMERNSNKYLVIDGQQRLKSVCFYFDGYYGEDGENTRSSAFDLKGINKNSPYFCKSFDDLSEEDQRKLNNSVLRAFIVQQLNPEDDTSMYHIFERLNTGGTLLSNQEIRNCVCHGKFAKSLDTLNEFGKWRDILGKPKVDTRKKDVELILRFLAMRDTTGYKSPMKDFLTKFMKKHKNARKQALQNSRIVFEKTCDAVVSHLGRKPFHVRTGLNAAVFDAVMTAFSNHLDNIPADVGKRYRNLVESEEFGRNTRSSTTNTDVVKGRCRQAVEYLFES